MDEYFNKEFQYSKQNLNDKKYSTEVKIEIEKKTMINQKGEPQYKEEKEIEEYQKPKLKELYDIILSNIEKFPNAIHYENIENIYNYLLEKFELIYSGYKNQNVKEIDIFGKDFVEKNKDNCYLLINGEKKALCEKYDRPDEEPLTIILVKEKEIENMSKMFFKCNFLHLVKVLTQWKFDNVNNLNSMFCGCENLKYIILGSELNTSKVIDFSNMFKDCKSLETKEYPLTLKFNTENGQKFKNMFQNCSSLTKIDGISDWKLNKAIDLSSMFSKCKLLEEIDLSKWEIPNAEYLNSMFSGCEQLKEIDLHKWDIPNAKDLNRMFYGCKQIRYIYFKKKLNCGKVINMDSMFADCENLEKLIDLSQWITDSLQSLNETFRNLPNLKEFSNISSWNVKNVISSKDTFEDFSIDVERPVWADKINNNNISTVSHTFD